MTASPLSPLAGKWVNTITMLHPPEERGRTYHALDSYEFLPGDKVMVHEVHGYMPGGPIRGIEIYTPDEGNGYVSRNFDSSGVVTDYTAEMKDGGWHIQGATETYSTTRLDENVIEGLWRRLEGSEWVDWMTVHLDRVAD